TSSIRRTHGGAFAYFPERFPTFHQRLQINQNQKRALAKNALSYIKPNSTIYLDGGTTVYLLAEELKANPVHPLTIITPNLPAIDLLLHIPNIEIHLTGGHLVPEQSILLGKAAIASVKIWKFDLAILSGRAFNSQGIWNEPFAQVELQQTAIRNSKKILALLDSSKLGSKAEELLISWDHKITLLTDTDPATLAAIPIPQTCLP
ncbi:MAG: DeoR/GlpR family DNA-binding transcription regulator, partial [Chthoniobacterales bacterium]|nr:DeoR/GlpR family DNA-binding transcription regulator [Chthoniobacterales bacterium]